MAPPLQMGRCELSMDENNEVISKYPDHNDLVCYVKRLKAYFVCCDIRYDFET